MNQRKNVVWTKEKHRTILLDTWGQVRERYAVLYRGEVVTVEGYR